jgi:hypothetical protein
MAQELLMNLVCMVVVDEAARPLAKDPEKLASMLLVAVE